MASLSVQDATSQDAHAITEITNHYIKESVATFYLPDETRTEADIRGTMESVQSHDLPYLVLRQTGSASVLAFAYAAPYRWERAGYKSTVEITVFLEAQNRGSGFGTALVTSLLDKLRERRPLIREVLCVMAYEPNSDMERVGRFYEKLGFVERAHLLQVGRKFDRWIDVKFYQMSLVGS